MTSETHAALTRPPAAPVQAVTADVLRAAAQALAATDSPWITAQALLADLLGLSRTQLLARLDQPIAPELRAVFEQAVRRAAAGEPLAYLTGRREFYGLEFQVDARVLVPRPETELLADLALEFAAERQRAPGARVLRVVDVGTGSGILAVTFAVKCPRARIWAVDLSAAALAVARANAERHQALVRVAFVRGDLMSFMAPAGCDVLVANLPYIPSAQLLGLPVHNYEPTLALDGGPDGMTPIRCLLADAPRVVAPGGCLLLEIGATQGEAVAALAQSTFQGAQLQRHCDLAGLDRVVGIRL
jgi:release factor glutamine methyltransferase